MKIRMSIFFGMLLLSLLLAVACTGTGTGSDTDTAVSTSTPVPEATPEPTADDVMEESASPSVDVLANATYVGIYDEAITLTDGSFEGEPVIEGSASRPTVTLLPVNAFGDLNGDGSADAAAILAESGGGSGTFIYLAVLINDAGTWRNVATTYLGDRVQVETMTIEAGEIVVAGVTHGPDDPMCCPSQAVSATYELQNDVLIQTSGQEFGMTESEPELIGSAWIWQQTLMNDGSEFIPENPSNYTVKFMVDGNVAVQADCNLVLGTYSTDGRSLTIELGPSTLVACPEGSLGDQFAANLAAANSYFFENDRLFIDLKLDSGTMQFTPQPTALAGTGWRVTGYNNGREAVVSPIIDTELTAVFNSDGTLSGSAGCNTYSAPYQVSDNSITIGLPIATMMECDQPEGIMTQEQEFLAALQTAATLEFRGDMLEFRTADDALAVTLIKVSASVSGTITTQQSIALPEDAVITVQIQDTSLADAPAKVIGEQIINPAGQQFPIAYEVPYNTADIDERNTYSIAARIGDGSGNLLFINDTNIPVITRNNPTTDVTIMVVAIGE